MRTLGEVSKGFFRYLWIFSGSVAPENFQRRDPLPALALRFWGWGRPWTYPESIDSPSLSVMIGIVRFASSFEVVFLNGIVVCEWGHMASLKKWETSVARCLPNTPIGLCGNRHIPYRNVIIIVCDYVFWISVEPYSPNRILLQPHQQTISLYIMQDTNEWCIILKDCLKHYPSICNVGTSLP